MKRKLDGIVIHYPTIKERLAIIYDKITLRKFYREKFKSEFRNLYNARIANLLDYLDGERATIIVSDRISHKEFDVTKSRVLICGENILFDQNVIKTNGGSGITAADSTAITISNSFVDGK